jgi:hypothetical protein
MRKVPVVGAEVQVAYLGQRLAATVVAVATDQRTVEVLTAEGERIQFALSHALARFVATDGSGAKLLFG